MKLVIVGKNFTVSEGLKSSLETKLSKLDKYFLDDVEAHVTMWTEKDRQAVEVTIPVKGTVLRAEEVTNDTYTSIDLVVDKLSNQISRYKTKIQAKNKGNSFLDYDEIEDYEEEDSLNIVKSKKFDIKPMSDEEAVLQMELIGHSFFVFINDETETVNVVYKRKDGKYGLIEPNY